MSDRNSIVTFPKWRFVLASATLLIVASLLSLWIVQEDFKKNLAAQFVNFSETTNNEIAAIVSLHRGVGANILTLNSIEDEFNSNLRVYIDEISKNRKDISFFTLPKVNDFELEAFEHKKREEGYLTYHIFGSAESYQLENQPIHFPVSEIKNHRITSLKHLGRDVYSYQHFFDAINIAIENNRITASWSYSTTDNPHGISLFLPIYDTNYIEPIPANLRMQRVQLLISSELF
jgi:hypothetical protein